MVDNGVTLDTFKITFKRILENRREFYGLQRRDGDPITIWLQRVEYYIQRCEFPMNLTEFLLVDRFICGLNSVELKTIENTNTWTFKQLLECFSDQNFITDPMIQEKFNQNIHISLDDVKSEPVCLSL